MDAVLLAMLVTPIQHAPYVSQDAYGLPTFGSLQTHLVKLEFRQQKVVDQAGIERLSRARMFLDPTVSLDVKDLIILPNGTRPPLLDVYEVLDVDGTRHHWEARL